MTAIVNPFRVTEKEYSVLNEKYGDLAEYISWQLIRKNSRNNHTDEQQDIAQEIRIALLRAGTYYKRQVYIESCLALAKIHAKDHLTECIVAELQNLWDNKTRHGANRQKFGLHQEQLLDQLVDQLVPEGQRPSKSESLVFDDKFSTYCKTIAWNAQKTMGKKITKEKPFRTGLVSLGDFDYLGSTKGVA